MTSVSILMAACQQGDWVRRTIPWAKAAIGDLDHEIIVVDDQSTDGCCKRLDRDVLIIRTHSRMGISGARRLAVENACGDVLIFSDPHCEYSPGALADLAKAAAKLGGIHQPRTCAAPVESHVLRGGRLAISDRGLHVAGCFSRAAEHPALINTIYAVRRDVYDRLGGWPHLPGVWGYSEQALSLTAWFGGEQVFVDERHICVHYRYQVNRQFSYTVWRRDVAANGYWVHAAFFPMTFETFWAPILRAKWGDNPEYAKPITTAAFRRFREHVAKLAKQSARTERDFFESVLHQPYPLDLEPETGQLKSVSIESESEAVADQQQFIAAQRKRSHPILYAQSRKRTEAVMRWMIQTIPGCANGRTALDVGTRDGYGVEVLRRLGFRKVEGIELVPDTARHASERLGGAVRQGDMRNLSDREGSWNVVICIHTIEHVPDPGRAREELIRVTTPGGWILVVVPKEESPIEKHAHNSCFPTVEALREFMLQDARLDPKTVHMDSAIFWPPDQIEFRFLAQRRKEGTKSRMRPPSNRGIVYQLTGAPSTELLATSLWSLRQHYDGPVTIFVTDETREIGEMIQADSRLAIDLMRTELCGGRWPHWTAKTFTYNLSPYDYSIYLDADTVVLTDPTPLFGDLVLAKCNDWRILDDQRYCRSIRRTIAMFRRNYGPVLPQMIDQSYKLNTFVVNCGMVSYAKNHPLFWEMHHLCIGLRDTVMYDEGALQLCLPRYHDVRFVDSAWNALVRFEERWDERRIVHYHHKTYAKEGRGQSTWIPHLQEAIAQNVAGIHEWAGRYNPYIGRLLSRSTIAKV